MANHQKGGERGERNGEGDGNRSTRTASLVSPVFVRLPPRLTPPLFAPFVARADFLYCPKLMEAVERSLVAR